MMMNDVWELRGNIHVLGGICRVEYILVPRAHFAVL